jgi:hypothetical protein
VIFLPKPSFQVFLFSCGLNNYFMYQSIKLFALLDWFLLFAQYYIYLLGIYLFFARLKAGMGYRGRIIFLYDVPMNQDISWTAAVYRVRAKSSVLSFYRYTVHRMSYVQCTAVFFTYNKTLKKGCGSKVEAYRIYLLPPLWSRL